MNAAHYADYMNDLKGLFEEIDTRPENFRTLDVHVELTHKGFLFVYQTKKKMGQTDSIFYARAAHTGENKQVSKKTAFDAMTAFMRHRQFLALTAERGGDGSIEQPCCAVSISYRRTGMEKTKSMTMIFLGFADTEEASDFASSAECDDKLVRLRAFRSDRLWEWR